MEENELIDVEIASKKRHRIFLIAGIIGILLVLIEAFTLFMDWFTFVEYNPQIPGFHFERPAFPFLRASIVLLLIPNWIGIINAKKWAYFGILAVLFGRLALSFIGIRMNVPIYPAYEILALIVLSYRLHEMKR